MNMKLLSLVASVALIGLAGSASAKDLKPLTNAQMDHVTAGATSITVGSGIAAGTIFSGVGVSLATAVMGHNAFGAGDVKSIAASFTPGPSAFAASGISAILVSP